MLKLLLSEKALFPILVIPFGKITLEREQAVKALSPIFFTVEANVTEERSLQPLKRSDPMLFTPFLIIKVFTVPNSDPYESIPESAQS